jgi:hypothetical protein
LLNTPQKRDSSATYIERSDLVYKADTLCVLEDTALKAELIRMHYDDPLTSHFSANKTTKLISYKY